MVALANFVLETCNAPGTAATITLSGAPAGRVAFASAFASGATVFYFLDDGTQAEWGYGALTIASPNTLNRATVLGNTAGNTSRLNFAGTTRVYNEVPAPYLLTVDPALNIVPIPSGARITGIGPASNPTDVPQLGQVAWQTIATTTATTGANFVSFSIPSALNLFALEFYKAQPAANAPAAVQFSLDGGSTWSTSCQWGAAGTTFSADTAIYFGPTPAALTVISGRALCLFPAAKTLITDSVTALQRFAGGGIDTSGGSPTNIRFTFAGSTIQRGIFRLIGST